MNELMACGYWDEYELVWYVLGLEIVVFVACFG